MEEFCKDCINCKEAWSASMNESCHNYCDKFQRWKEGTRPITGKGEGNHLNRRN